MVKKWQILFTKRAQQDAKKLKSTNLSEKAKKLIDILKDDPLQNPPEYKKLLGELSGCYSRRINIQHRLVYRVDTKKHTVIVIAMFSHYQM